jgi:hypothetical protein
MVACAGTLKIATCHALFVIFYFAAGLVLKAVVFRAIIAENE